MVSVRIYRPAKSAMQSGKAKTQYWLMEYERSEPQYIEPLMHWVGRDSTRPQVIMRFNTQAAAVDFANRNGWDYKVELPYHRKSVAKSYADNFRCRDLKNFDAV